MPDVFGFDMGPTIQWYWDNLANVVKNLPIAVPTIHGDRIDTPCFRRMVQHDRKPVGSMDAASFVAAALLFPPQARARSYLRDIFVEPPLWFHRDSPSRGPKPTQNIAEALSPSAIIPSYIGYAKWGVEDRRDKRFGYAANIQMYEMPGTGLPKEILDQMGHLRATLRRVIWSQAFLHEFGHSIVTPALFRGARGRKLRLPSGRIVGQHRFLMEALRVMESLPPISHYASAYSNPNGSLKLDGQGSVHTALGEHLVEAMSAELLGFAFRMDDTGLDPFHGREALRDFVVAFLDAEWVD